MPTQRGQRSKAKVVRVPRYVFADEEPEVTLDEWEVENELGSHGIHISDCEFCGQDGHRFADCPNRLQPYQTDTHETRYS